MSTLHKLELALKECEELNEDDLKALRKMLWKAFYSVHKKLEHSSKKKSKSNNYCPRCRSSDVIGHGKKTTKRFLCMVCGVTFVKERHLLYYRRRDPDKIIDLIVAIHTSDKSTSEIMNQLKIPVKTYYQWKDDILLVFPQLKEKFKNRGKK